MAPPAAPSWAPVAAQAGQVRRGWFGISLSCEDCFIQRGPGRVAWVTPPAIVSVESGSPAWQAGMRNGDTIITIDGAAVTQPEGFERFAGVLPGQSVRVGLRRAGQEREVTVTPTSAGSASTIPDYYNSRLRIAQRNGFRAYESLFRTPAGLARYGHRLRAVLGQHPAPPRGLVVPPVAGRLQRGRRRPAHRMGIRRGDTLIAIDGVDLTDPAGGRAFAQVEPGQRVNLTVRRAGTERRVPLVAVARPDATPQELSAFDEYKRMRDSSDAQYRDILRASVSRAQTEITDLQRSLVELEATAPGVDSSRRRLATIDSLLRALRNLERQRWTATATATAPASG